MIIWNNYNVDQKNKILNNTNLNPYTKGEVSRILQKDFADFTKKDWWTLRAAKIINGVWPSYFSKFLRFIISIIFFAVDYKRHDVNYFIGGMEVDRKKADDGLLKYSVLTIFEVLKKLRFTNTFFINIILTLIYLPLTIFYLIITTPFLILVLFSYIMVRGFWHKSFNFIKK